MASFRGETDLIQSIFAPLARGYEGAFGLVDDAALLTPAPGEEIVLTADMLVAGVHFLANASPADAAYKALAVNISDLVAKGADPEIYLLTLALPGKPDRAWLGGFADGLADAQAAFGCLLAGGDTVSTPGPLCISITALGRIPEGKIVKRSGARPGDRVYVTGTIGDAVAGLKWLRAGDEKPQSFLTCDGAGYLGSRYWRPRPNRALAPILRDHASGAMDISDGLAGDFEKLCKASRCGGSISAGRVPLSGAAKSLLRAGFVSLEELLCGGDDYEVLAAIAPGKTGSFEKALQGAGCQATDIGEILTEHDVLILGLDGAPLDLSHAAYDHFQ